MSTLGATNSTSLFTESTGWVGDSSTWTYASSTTFTISGDVTAKFRKGTKLWLTQTTSKYFYVVSSSYGAPNTTVTITGGTDYTLANAAITAPYYSYQDNPQGFPSLHAYTPTFSSTSGSPDIGNGTLTGYFSVSRGLCYTFIYFVVGSTTNMGTGQIKLSLPLAEATTGTMRSRGFAQLVDAGTASYNSFAVMDSSGSSDIRLQYTNTSATGTATSSAPFTWGTSDAIEVEMIHKI